jgi:uncharacterized cupredoxin-like copper-binding protein
MRGAIVVALASALGLILVACTGVGGGMEVPVVSGEREDGRMYFYPDVITIEAGTKVTFVITNEGNTDHEFESDEARIEEIIVPPGRTRRVTWTAPSKPGTFPIYCDLPGHREAGMELTLAVVERTSSPTSSLR